MSNQAFQRGYQLIQNGESTRTQVSILDYLKDIPVFCNCCNTILKPRSGYFRSRPNKENIKNKDVSVQPHFYHTDENRDYDECIQQVKQAIQRYNNTFEYSLIKEILDTDLKDIPLHEKLQQICVEGKIQIVSVLRKRFAYEFVIQTENIKDFSYLNKCLNMVFIYIMNDVKMVQIKDLNNNITYYIEAPLNFKKLDDNVQLFLYDRTRKIGYKPSSLIPICKQQLSFQRHYGDIIQDGIRLTNTYFEVTSMYNSSLHDIIDGIAELALVPVPVQFPANYQEKQKITYQININHQENHCDEYLLQQNCLYDYQLSHQQVFYYCKGCKSDKWHSTISDRCNTCKHNYYCKKCVQCSECTQCNGKLIQKLISNEKILICTKCTLIYICKNPNCSSEMLQNTTYCSDRCIPKKCNNPTCNAQIYGTNSHCSSKCEPQYRCLNSQCTMKLYSNTQHCSSKCEPKYQCLNLQCNKKTYRLNQHCSNQCEPKYQCKNPQCNKKLYENKQYCNVDCEPKYNCPNPNCINEIHRYSIALQCQSIKCQHPECETVNFISNPKDKSFYYCSDQCEPKYQCLNPYCDEKIFYENQFCQNLQCYPKYRCPNSQCTDRKHQYYCDIRCFPQFKCLKNSCNVKYYQEGQYCTRCAPNCIYCNLYRQENGQQHCSQCIQFTCIQCNCEQFRNIFSARNICIQCQETRFQEGTYKGRNIQDTCSRYSHQLRDHFRLNSPWISQYREKILQYLPYDY